MQEIQCERKKKERKKEEKKNNRGEFYKTLTRLRTKLRRTDESGTSINNA